jgi:acetyl-CoA acetyltransferase family protein
MLAGDTKTAVVGGVENMSMSPYAIRGARWGLRMGHAPLSDVLMESLEDSFVKLPMAMTAENLGEKYGIHREQVDAFALRSQQFCQEAAQNGKFQEEIVPFVVKDRKGNAVTLHQDEHPKKDTTLAKLQSLKALFKKEGLVTAGNASGIVDGAAALVVSTASEAARRKLKPLGRLVAYGISGCDPRMMGIGPVAASQQALQRAGLTLDQMDLIEVNEAFAAQTLAVVEELRIPMDKLNVNGGAIAIGHPLAASGARIIQTMLYELRRRQKRYALGSACIGGGQGIAVIVESLGN